MLENGRCGAAAVAGGGDARVHGDGGGGTAVHRDGDAAEMRGGGAEAVFRVVGGGGVQLSYINGGGGPGHGGGSAFAAHGGGGGGCMAAFGLGAVAAGDAAVGGMPPPGMPGVDISGRFRPPAESTISQVLHARRPQIAALAGQGAGVAYIGQTRLAGLEIIGEAADDGLRLVVRGGGGQGAFRT